MQERDAPNHSALASDVERQLGELAQRMVSLADDLEGGFDVRPEEVRRAAERAAAAADAVRFQRIVDGVS